MKSFTEFFWDESRGEPMAHRTDGVNHVLARIDATVPSRYIGEVLSNMRELLTAFKHGIKF